MRVMQCKRVTRIFSIRRKGSQKYVDKVTYIYITLYWIIIILCYSNLLIWLLKIYNSDFYHYFYNNIVFLLIF